MGFGPRIPSLVWFVPLSWVWIFLERTQSFSGIQFTRHFIGFVIVETKRFVSSHVNVILTRQTCGQLSMMSAGSKFWALAFYFFSRICYIFQIPKCRRESNLGMCTTLLLSKRMPLRICKFRRNLRPDTFFNRNSPIRSGILFKRTEVVHRPRSDFDLCIDIRNI